ncbi:MAG TPA: hypothetical protein VF043_33905 [Ktedonobacteraceae bacterium]
MTFCSWWASCQVLSGSDILEEKTTRHRDRAYTRRHRVGGSGATTAYGVPQHIRSVRYYRRAA